MVSSKLTFANPQSAIRNPQSAIRNPQSPINSPPGSDAHSAATQPTP
jgi:hypothetical protein